MRRTFLVTILINFATCRDFYLGMFKKNDLLMSHDTVYKERIPFRVTYAKYGRVYNCPITYVRVLDRLNIGRGPRVEIVRGGLQKKYIVLRLTSPYNNPIAVNIFVGCENKEHTRPPWRIIRPTHKTTGSDVTKATVATTVAGTSKAADETIPSSADAVAGDVTTVSGPDPDTTAAEGETSPETLETTPDTPPEETTIL